MGDNIVGARVVKNITRSTCEQTEDIDGKKEDTNDNSGQNKNVLEPNNIIRRHIYKEFEGVKSLGTVTRYIHTMGVFEVQFQYDNRIEYLEQDFVLRNIEKKEELCGIQQLPLLRNTLKKAVESEVKKSALEEMSRYKRGRGPSVASSSRVVKKRSSWFSKKENATETEPYELYQFMGLYICKKHNGVRCLGTVVDYNLEENKLIVKYKVDGKIEYFSQMDALYNMAKREDFSPAQSTPSSSGSKKTDKKMLTLENEHIQQRKKELHLAVTKVMQKFLGLDEPL